MGFIADLAGTGVQLMGQQEESAFNQVQALQNAQLAEFAAADTVARGNREAAFQRMEGGDLVGRQKVAYAASGVDPTVGTAAAVQADTRARSEMDAMQIENNAAREAWGFRTTGKQYKREAQQETIRNNYRQTGTALSGISRATKSAF